MLPSNPQPSNRGPDGTNLVPGRQPTGYEIAGRPAAECLWRRAADDAWSILRTPLPWIAEAVATVAVAAIAVVLTDSMVVRIAAPLIAFAAVLILTGITSVLRAPIKQRDEARVQAAELCENLRPKLTVRNLEVQSMPPEIIGDVVLMTDVLRLLVENDSDSAVRKCEAKLLEIKPLVEWLPLIEGYKTAHGGSDFTGLPEIPLPMSLSWSSGATTSVDIPIREQAWLDVCYYGMEGSKIFLAFPSDDLRRQYALPDTHVVLSLRVDSEDCRPVFCICRYIPNPRIQEASDSCVIEYLGVERRSIDQYRQFRRMPRPAHWDDESAE